MDSRFKKRLAIVVMLLLFASLNYAAPILAIHGPRELSFFGIIAGGVFLAEFQLLAIWAAMGPGHWLSRWSLITLLTVLNCMAFVLGALHARGLTGISELIEMGAAFFLYVQASQAPLWLLKKISRRQLVGWEETQLTTRHERSQFRILDILKCMAYLSVTLACLQFIPFAGVFTQLYLVGLAIGLIVWMFMLAVVSPCVWGAFAAKRKLILLGFAWLFYCLVVMLPVVGLAIGLLPGPDPGAASLLFYPFIVADCLTVYFVMLFFRRLGVQFVRLDKRSGGQPEILFLEPSSNSSEPQTPFDAGEETETPPIAPDEIAFEDEQSGEPQKKPADPFEEEPAE